MAGERDFIPDRGLGVINPGVRHVRQCLALHKNTGVALDCSPLTRRCTAGNQAFDSLKWDYRFLFRHFLAWLLCLWLGSCRGFLFWPQFHAQIGVSDWKV